MEACKALEKPLGKSDDLPGGDPGTIGINTL
jgi:hypothetical protein